MNATRPGQIESRLRPRRPARRGSIYAVVLGLSILVALIGLSTVVVGRINLRTTSVSGEAGEAELLAMSAVEHAVSVVNTDTKWRSTYVHDQPVPRIDLGRGAFRWKLMDDADNDLRYETGGAQPARLVGYGFAGVARRAFSVRLYPTGANLLENPGFEAGVAPYERVNTDCQLTAITSDFHAGTRSLSVTSRTGPSAGPQQNVTGKVFSDRSYYVEAWVKMTTAEERPTISLVAKGTDLLLLAWEKTFSANAEAVKPAAGWTRVHVTLNPVWSGTADAVQLRIETSTTSQSFSLDDLKLIDGASLETRMGLGGDTWKQVPVEEAVAAN